MVRRLEELTLDTNLLREHWSRRSKAPVVREILRLAAEDVVEIAVTRVIREDFPNTRKLAELAHLRITETPTAFRVGISEIGGPDRIGLQVFEDFFAPARKLAAKRGATPPDRRDWTHLHSHLLLERDVFLTWDEGIRRLAPELQEQFSLRVMRPEEYLHARLTGSSSRYLAG